MKKRDSQEAIFFVGAMVLVIFIALLFLGTRDLLRSNTFSRAEMNGAATLRAGKPAPATLERVVRKNAFAHGPQNAKVTVVEFLDFQCPFCRRVAPSVKTLMSEYRDKSVRFLFRHLPLTNIHKAAWSAALASICAQEQNKFLELHDLLYENQESISEGALPLFASKAGLEMRAYTSCMSERRGEAWIRKDVADAADLGLVGTPTFFVNSFRIEGAQSIEVFRRAIDEALQ